MHAVRLWPSGSFGLAFVVFVLLFALYFFSMAIENALAQPRGTLALKRQHALRQRKDENIAAANRQPRDARNARGLGAETRTTHHADTA